jgi:hypothetical protein
VHLPIKGKTLVFSHASIRINHINRVFQDILEIARHVCHLGSKGSTPSFMLQKLLVFLYFMATVLTAVLFLLLNHLSEFS